MALMKNAGRIQTNQLVLDFAFFRSADILSASGRSALNF
jgi:hypothetical protein